MRASVSEPVRGDLKSETVRYNMLGLTCIYMHMRSLESDAASSCHRRERRVRGEGSFFAKNMLLELFFTKGIGSISD